MLPACLSEVKRLYRSYWALILVALYSFFLLSSCGSSPQKYPEGNIDVDSEIYIVPIGDNVDEKYLYPLIPKLEKRFTTKVHLALDKRLPNPDHAYDFEAKQYVAMYVLRDLIELDVPENAKVLGVVINQVDIGRSDYGYYYYRYQYYYGNDGKKKKLPYSSHRETNTKAANSTQPNAEISNS